MCCENGWQIGVDGIGKKIWMFMDMKRNGTVHKWDYKILCIARFSKVGMDEAGIRESVYMHVDQVEESMRA